MATRNETVKAYEHAEAFDEGYLQVSDIHKLYYHCYGKKDGKPVVFIHGGPGGSTSKDSAGFFDPNVYRVVLFDQRGAGKSTPAAELEENRTKFLVQDIETLRKHLSIAKWHMVFGGSWGSTLSLVYAIYHPESVGSIVLRGIWTVRKSEVDFTIGADGTSRLFPEAYEEFITYLPEDKRSEPLRSYYELLISPDPAVHLPAAKAYNKWELSISQLVPDSSTLKKLDDDTWSLQHARIEAHYACHGAWLEEGGLLRPDKLEKLKHVPCSIVQGRYDIVCPPKTAWELHKAWPGSRLYMIPDVGHSANEPGTKKKLIEICDEYGQLDLV